MNFYQQLDYFITYLAAERGASPHTIEAYNRDILEFVKFCEEHPSNQPDGRMVELYMGHLQLPGH
jgi:site-specific recombinase XerD